TIASLVPTFMNTPCFRLALTPGEPAGIGPDLAILLAQQAQDHEIVAIADRQLLEERAALLKLPVRFREINLADAPRPLAAGELAILPIALTTAAEPGKLNKANAGYILKTLDAAIAGCQSGAFAALVTGPVHKGVINEAGIP